MKGTTLLGFVCLATVAHAATITFDFSSATGNLGAAHTYTSSSGNFNVTATAEPAGTSNRLFGKALGGDENGVGLTSDPSGQDEITPGFFIQLDLVNILGNNPLTIVMESTTGNDSWQIFNTATANSLTGATSLATGSSEGTGIIINPTKEYLDITATSGNVLLGSLSFNHSSTPEPASLALIACGLGALCLRRRWRKQ